jgi:alkylation response protein AidB-like acyl-CoA dehydrogenase
MSTVLSAPRPALTTLTEQERMLQEAVRDFAVSEIAPRAQAMDHAQQMDRAIIDQLFQLGLMGIEVPERYGGTGADFFTSAIGVIEDVQNTLVDNAILRWADDAQKARWLPSLAADTVGAYALSESGSGSDAFALACRAVADGDDWLLRGQKMWITNGNEADLFIVFATVDPDAGYKGITAFVVERDQPGFTVGKKEDKLGIRASSTTELVFDGVRIPPENVLGEVGKGYKVAIETLNEGRIGIGAQMLGLAQGALDHTVAYVREREQFGRAIGSFQGVQFQIAEMATDIEAARLLVYNAARLKDAGEPFLQQAAMAKLFASEVAQQVASRCIDLFGGNGFTKEFPVEKLYRDAKIGTIYEGTSNMQKQTIAKMLLK